MSISPVSSSMIHSTPRKTDDGVIQALEKQKNQLKSQLQKVKQSDMELKQKQDKIKELSDQITEVETQIRQRMLEKAKEESSPEKQAEKIAESNEKQATSSGKDTDEAVKNDINSEHMLSALSGYSDLKTLGKVRTAVKSEMHHGKSTIANLPEASAKLDQVEEKMKKVTKQIDHSIKKAAEREVVHKEHSGKKVEHAEEEQTGENVTSTDGAGSVNGVAMAGATAGSSFEKDGQEDSEKNGESRRHRSTEKGQVIDVLL